MNWKTCFLPLLLAAAVLGSVTAFADGEPVGTAKQDEVLTEDTTDGWVENTYTDKQGITYELKDNTITVTDGSKAKGDIIIPATIEKDGISYLVTSIGDNAFAYCWQLVSVTFSGNIGSIGNTAFENCGALESVTFSGKVDSIESGAFYDCDDLKNVTFYGNVGSIGSTAFVDCNALENVTFSGNVGSIGDSAFFICYQLNTVTFSGNVGSIRDHAFTNAALETVTFSGDVTSIGYGAFSSCSALENVTFSGDVGNIGYGAFRNCGALESVTFSGNVGSIGGGAFQYCTTLTTIYVPVSMSDEKIAMIETALEDSDLYNVQIEKFEPEQPSDPAPSTGTPSAPATGTTGSASTAVQQLEAAERPDPMDVEATERYNFWMDVKSDLRAAGDGRTVRVYVPADYTNMPASVMETIRTLGKEITIDLRWNGQRLIITPQTALQRPARKAFWTFDALCEVYAR